MKHHRTKKAAARLPWLFALLVIGTLLLTACNGAVPTETVGKMDPRAESADPTVSEDLSAGLVDSNLVTAYNELGIRIFTHTVDQSGDDESVFMSPTSIALALSMAYNGAEGSTARAMAEAMQLGDLSRDAVNASSLALLTALDSAQAKESDALGIQLDIANSIWHRREFQLNDAFVQDNAHFYRADVAGLDFKEPTSVDTINRWVSDATQGLIPTVVERLDDDLVMMLINAVYFNGDWTTPFNKNRTIELPFYLEAGDTQDVPMMYRDGQIDYYAQEGMQAIRLPYGDDERLAMYVFLPSSDRDLASFAGDLTYDRLEDIFDSFTVQHGEIMLPRMDIAYKTKLNDVLASLGMGIAFDGGKADFSRMSSNIVGRNLYLGDVIHQSVLKVDEEGTEAAAVTSIDVRVTSLPMYDFRFRADRPFIIAIRDDVTKALLFIGAIMDPLS